MEKEEFKEWIKDRNLIRINKVVMAEFEIEEIEFLIEQKDKWFKKHLDFSSFIIGFSSGINYLKRIKEGHNLEYDEEFENGKRRIWFK